MMALKVLLFFPFLSQPAEVLLVNETSTINAMIMIRYYDDFNRKTKTATVEVVGKRD